MALKKDVQSLEGQSTAADAYLVERAQGMLDTIAAISKHTDVEEVAEEIGRQLVLLLSGDAAIVLQKNLNSSTYELWADHGLPANDKKEIRQSIKNIDFSPLLDEGSRLPVKQFSLKDASKKKLLILDKLSKNFISAVLIPLGLPEEPLGQILLLNNSKERVFSEAEIKMAQVLAGHAAMAIQQKRSLEKEQHRADELEALRLASLNLTATLDLEKVLASILESALDLMDGTLDAHIFLYDGQFVEFGAALWADGSSEKSWSQPRRNGLTYNVAESGDIVLVPDMGDHPLFKDTPAEWSGAIIGMPLKVKGEVVGVMNVAYSKPREFSEKDLRVLNLLAEQAAIAIENACLHKLSQHQAFTDSLTSLPNRRAFDSRLKEEIRRSARYGHSFTLAMMDLDGFKHVNDSYGHPAGDRALKAIATCLRLNVRGTDFLARYGGDEFVLILPETTEADTLLVAEKLKRIVEECPMEWQKEGKSDFLKLSVGVTMYPQYATEAEKLIQLADKSLYGVKGE